MIFADRLEIALSNNILLEMASFSLPDPIPLVSEQGKTVSVKYLDMRWEDYRNPYISRWGQWTPFSAELPIKQGDNRYLIWDGIRAWTSRHRKPEYYTAPKNWWRMAQGLDENGRIVLKPRAQRKTEL